MERKARFDRTPVIRALLAVAGSVGAALSAVLAGGATPPARPSAPAPEKSPEYRP